MVESVCRIGYLMFQAREMNNEEFQKGQPMEPAHSPSSPVPDIHQPAEWVVVRANSELCPFDEWTKRQNVRNDCKKFPLGFQESPFHVCQGTIPIADWHPIGRVLGILLFKDCDADLISRGVCVDKEWSVRNRKCSDGRLHQAPFECFKGLSLFGWGLVPSCFNVLSLPTIQASR